MGKMQREKGKAWEREMACKLREVFGDRVHRGWQAREGSDAPDLVGIPRFWPECKADEKRTAHAAMEQAVEALRMARLTAKLWPVVFFKKNRKVPLAVMRVDDFLALLKEWCAVSRPDWTAAANAALKAVGAEPPSKKDLVEPLIVAMAPAFDAPCPHPARHGKHEVYATGDDGLVCRACGVRSPKPAARLGKRVHEPLGMRACKYMRIENAGKPNEVRICPDDCDHCVMSWEDE